MKLKVSRTIQVGVKAIKKSAELEITDDPFFPFTSESTPPEGRVYIMSRALFESLDSPDDKPQPKPKK